MLRKQRQILSLVRLPVPPLQLLVDYNSGSESFAWTNSSSLSC